MAKQFHSLSFFHPFSSNSSEDGQLADNLAGCFVISLWTERLYLFNTTAAARRCTNIHLCGKRAAMAEMKAITKHLASGLRKRECRQHCRRLTHICPHSDRSLGLIDREQSGCHYVSLTRLSLSLFYSFCSFSAGTFEFSQFWVQPLPACTSVQRGRTEGSLKASQSDEPKTSWQVLTPGLLTSQHFFGLPVFSPSRKSLKFYWWWFVFEDDAAFAALDHRRWSL